MPIVARVHSTRKLTDHVYELLLQPEVPLPYQAGQWVSLALPTGPTPPLKRAYSMACPPRADGLIELVYDHVPNGLGSSYLTTLEEDASVEISACMGKFILPETLPSRMVMAARYTGIVPIRGLLMELKAREFKGRINLVYSSPCDTERFFHGELQALGLDGLQTEFVTLDGLDDELPEFAALSRYLGDSYCPDTLPLICGVKEMAQPLRAYLKSLGYGRKEILCQRYT